MNRLVNTAISFLSRVII